LIPLFIRYPYLKSIFWTSRQLTDMSEIAIQELLYEWDRTEQDEKWDKWDDIVFENLSKTLFMNGKWELVISLPTVMNDISLSLSVNTVPIL
jgi:hypothetical protein